MSSIPYSFHWVRQTFNREKQQDKSHHLDLPSTPTLINISKPMKINSFMSYKSELSCQYPQFDFEILHSIV